MTLEIFAAHCKDMMQAYPQLTRIFAEEFRHAFAAIEKIRSLIKDSADAETKICQAATLRLASIIAAHRDGKSAL